MLLDRVEVAAWWELAQSDLRVAAVVAALQPPEWRLVCFLSQQAAEKALKALMEARQVSVPRTHDLALLAEKLQVLVPVEAIADAALLLSIYGVGPRYPGPAGAANADEALAALAAARQVVAWAEERLAVAELEPQ